VFHQPAPLVVHLDPEQTAPVVARRALQQLLGDASAPFQLTSDALLLTSEIVTNATMVGAACEMSAWYLPDTGDLRVEVFDRSPVVPTLPPHRDPHAISGRGLRIVDSVASKWGIDPQADGKYVWFELRSH